MPASREALRGERIDTIVCLNVLEHIEEDAATLADFASVLEPGGRLVLLVPAMPALYGSLDVHLNHFRRYDREPLGELVTRAGFDVQTIRYLNRPGCIRLVAQLARAEAPRPAARAARGLPVDPAAAQARREEQSVVRDVAAGACDAQARVGLEQRQDQSE